MAEEQKFLSIDEILSVDDTTYKVVEVPAWTGSVRLGSLNAEAVLAFVDAPEKEKNVAGIRLLVESLVDASGKRIGNKGMIEKFKTRDMQTINMLVKEILTLNGMDDKKAAEAVKNDSGETATAASPSV